MVGQHTVGTVEAGQSADGFSGQVSGRQCSSCPGIHQSLEGCLSISRSISHEDRPKNLQSLPQNRFTSSFSFKDRFIHLFIYDRQREREGQRHRRRKKQAPCPELDVGLDPRFPRSRPGPKAGAKPLSHSGIHRFVSFFLRNWNCQSWMEFQGDLITVSRLQCVETWLHQPVAKCQAGIVFTIEIWATIGFWGQPQGQIPWQYMEV